MQKAMFRVLAARCHTDSCCPVIMESQQSDDIVIVGDVLNDILTSPDVKKKIGNGEAAVVIPKALLLEALKNL